MLALGSKVSWRRGEKNAGTGEKKDHGARAKSMLASFLGEDLLLRLVSLENSAILCGKQTRLILRAADLMGSV